jgi:hypothetical protein
MYSRNPFIAPIIIFFDRLSRYWKFPIPRVVGKAVFFKAIEPRLAPSLLCAELPFVKCTSPLLISSSAMLVFFRRLSGSASTRGFDP